MQSAFENYDQRRQDLLHLAGFSERFDSAEDFLSQLSLLGNTDDESAAADLSGGRSPYPPSTRPRGWKGPSSS